MKSLPADGCSSRVRPVGMPVAVAVEQIFFTSPSGNIDCFMDPWTVRCDIRDRNWPPATETRELP